MPKIKKTRKQKMLADQRHHTEFPKAEYSLQSQAVKISSASQSSMKEPPSKNVVITHNYGYLTKDLWKTVILTVSIIVLELMIKQLTLNS